MTILRFVTIDSENGKAEVDHLSMIRSHAARNRKARKSKNSGRPSSRDGDDGGHVPPPARRHLVLVPAQKLKRPVQKMPSGLDLLNPSFAAGAISGFTSSDFTETIKRLNMHANYMEASEVLSNGYIGRCLTRTIYRYHCINARTMCLKVAVFAAGAQLEATCGRIQDNPKRAAAALHALGTELGGQLQGTQGIGVVCSIVVLCLADLHTQGIELNRHIDGLKSAIKVQGGIDNVADGQVRYFLDVADSYAAIYQDVRPRFYGIKSPQLRVSAKDAEIPFLISSPLAMHEPFQSARKYNDHISDESIEILRKAFEAFEACKISSMRPDTNGSGESGLSYPSPPRDETPSPPSDSDEDAFIPGLPTAHYLNQAIKLASQILTRATAHNIPFSDEDNANDVQALFECLRWTGLSAWRGLPAIYLWIVITGATAAAHMDMQRRWFQSEASRCALGFGFGSVIPAMTIMRNHLWLMDLHRTPSNMF